MQVKKVYDSASTSLDNIQRQLATLPREAYKFWVNNTPKRTGNARNKTSLSRNTIEARYQYAEVLDKGSSRQAPKGMSGPTSEFLTRLIRRIIRK